MRSRGKKLVRAPRLAVAALAFVASHGPMLRAATPMAPLVSARSSTEPETPHIQPAVRSLFAHRARTGETLRSFRPSATFESTGRLPVLVRLRDGHASDALARLAREGVEFERHGEPIASGARTAVTSESGLRALSNDRDVLRVAVDLWKNAPRPLDRAAVETGASLARRFVLAKRGEVLDGTGTVIADIDSPMHIHHPAFFRADGGATAWLDVDGDGRLTPGKDGVDLDGDGTIAEAEVLRELRSTALSPYTREVIDHHASFEADRDYLFLDTNGDGKRNYGRAFSEATEAYGEPIFVFDDANQDHVLASTERVLRLKTSKVKRVRSQGLEYRRGADDATALVKYSPESIRTQGETIAHATGVVGILAGGQLGVSRYLGIAPGVELLLDDSTSDRGSVSAVQWALDSGANVILTEYAVYAGVTLDGSSEEETILDAAAARGVLTVSPSGNLAGGRKHQTVMLAPGTTTFALPTDAYFEGSRVAEFSMHYRGAPRTLSVRWTMPSGAAMDLPDSAETGVAGPEGSLVYVAAQTTPRGTHERFVTLTRTTKLPMGTYGVAITLDAGASVPIDLFVGDDVNAWAYGLQFDADTPTRTVCSPATSEGTISVAAYVLHDALPFFPAGESGALARYSSRGPRLDGVSGIDIAAPDNPLTTQPPVDGYEGPMFAPFGGTSGAGPHVAAAIALARQAEPKATAQEIRTRLLEGARAESEPGAATTFGHGKLDIAATVGGDVASGRVPEVRLRIEGVPHATGSVFAVVDAIDDEPAAGLTARWDLDYDGTFDTGWLALGRRPISLATALPGERHGVKAVVRDGQGNVGGATLAFDVLAAPETALVGGDGCGCRTSGRTPSPAALLAAFGITVSALLRSRYRVSR